MMRKPAILLRRWVAGTAVAGALAFGGAQALATPAAAAPPPTCDEVCNRLCRAIGAFGGFCPSPGSCVCYLR